MHSKHARDPPLFPPGASDYCTLACPPTPAGRIGVGRPHHACTLAVPATLVLPLVEATGISGAGLLCTVDYLNSGVGGFVGARRPDLGASTAFARHLLLSALDFLPPARWSRMRPVGHGRGAKAVGGVGCAGYNHGHTGKIRVRIVCPL